MADNESTMIQTHDGSKTWWKDGEIHREDGPAFENEDGSNIWVRMGKIHREDGPAVERADGINRWFLFGKEYNCVEWMLQVHELNQKNT